MSQVKLFSSSGGARVAKRSGRQKKQKVKKPLKTLAIWLLVILCLEGLYFFCIYTNNCVRQEMAHDLHQHRHGYHAPPVAGDVFHPQGRHRRGPVRIRSVQGRDRRQGIRRQLGQDRLGARRTGQPSTSNGSGNVTHIDPNVTHETGHRRTLMS